MFYPILFLIFCFNYITVLADIVYPCLTPDNKKGYCVSLFSCPPLLKAAASSNSSAIQYVKESICLNVEAGDFMVCCIAPSENQALGGVSPTTSTTTTEYSTHSDFGVELFPRYKEAIRQRLLPDETYCGYQQTDDRPYNSSVTALDEFPWLVQVRFSNLEYNLQYGDRCNGVLISNRYVLTDADCGAESIKVKIGEYNTNQTVSCDNSSLMMDCNEPVYDVAVEEIIRDGDPLNGPNDFALLRLRTPLQYSDFVRPICLPIGQGKRPELKSLVFSGWGASNDSGTKKKRLTYNIVNDDVCYNEDKYLKTRIKRANVSLLCTSPPEDPNGIACYSEHGGPFMYNLTRRRQWYVEGVIISVVYNENNFNLNNICEGNRPVYGIRITDNTIDWILSTIRP